MHRALISLLACVLLTGTAAGAEATGPQLELGEKAPSFELKGTDGERHSLDSIKGAKGTAVIFTCNHCPYSKMYEDRLIDIARDYDPKGIAFVAINPNDPAVQPQDGFEEMVARAKEKGFPFPYLLDETQQTARAYGAQVTPHVFVFDGSGILRYRGRVDDSPKAEAVKRHDLRDALQAIVEGKPIENPATKAFGCSVKWKKPA